MSENIPQSAIDIAAELQSMASNATGESPPPAMPPAPPAAPPAPDAKAAPPAGDKPPAAQAEAKPDEKPPEDRPKTEPDKPKAEDEDAAYIRAERAMRGMRGENQQLRGENQQLRQSVTQMQQQWQQIVEAAKRDPRLLFQALGMPIEQHPDVAERLHLDVLGNDAPADLRDRVAVRTLQRENLELRQGLSEIKQMIAQQQQQAQQQSNLGAFRAQLQGGLSKLTPESAPHVYVKAQKKPDKVVDALVQLSYAWADEHGTVPSPSDVIPLLEKALADEVGDYGPIYQQKVRADVATTLNADEPRTAVKQVTTPVTSREPPRPVAQDRDELNREIAKELEASMSP